MNRKEPLCKSIMRFDTDSPMPEPSVFVVKNGTNICSATSFAISGALSLMSIATQSLLWMYRACATIVEAPASIAFFKRFTITCTTNDSSALTIKSAGSTIVWISTSFFGANSVALSIISLTYTNRQMGFGMDVNLR